MSVTVIGRLYGGAIFEPKEKNNRLRYEAHVAMDEENANKLEAAMKEAAAEKWGEKIPKNLEMHGPTFGDDPDFEVSYGQYHLHPKASHKMPVRTCIKRGGKLVDVKREDDIIYNGAYCAFVLETYAYDADKSRDIHKPGVTTQLRAVMFVKHGERITGDNTDAALEGIESEEGEMPSDEEDLLD